MKYVTYWTGRMPPVIALCIETMRKNLPDFELVDDVSLMGRWGGGELTGSRALQKYGGRSSLRVAQWSDLVRLHLLSQCVGPACWLDADCVVRSEPRFERKLLDGPIDLLVVSNRTRAYPNPIIASRAPRCATAFLNRALRKVEAIHPTALGYTALGQDVLADREVHEQFDVVRIDRRPDVHPLTGTRGDMSFTGYASVHPAFVEKWADWDHSVAHIVNFAISKQARQSREEVLKAPTLLSELIRRALA